MEIPMKALSLVLALCCALPGTAEIGLMMSF